MEISRIAISVSGPDGSVVPFDSDLYQRRIEEIFERGGSADPELASDIACALEYALNLRLRQGGPEVVPADEIDRMAAEQLSAAGYPEAAAEFRRTFGAGTELQVSLTSIRMFLADELAVSDDELDRISRKVFNTMQTIGADISSHALILELAHHFQNRTRRSPVEFLPRQRRIFAGPDGYIPFNVYAGHVPDPALEFVRNGSLTVRRIDLRVFPVLRISVDLEKFGSKLTPPVTELMLMPEFQLLGEAIDSIALAADEACAACGHETDTPLKLQLHFAATGTFTHDRMGSSGEEGTKYCAQALAELMCLMLARQPIRITC